MGRSRVAAFVIGGAALVVAFVWVGRRELVNLASRAALGGPAGKDERNALREIAEDVGRVAVSPERRAVAVALPADRGIPADEQGLGEFIAWMRGLGHDELLRLSNAEYGFEQSELVQRLQGLEGPWVVGALGDFAVAELDPLLKAILVKGLVGMPTMARLDDGRLVPILDSLVAVMSHAPGDPYQVAPDLAMAAYGASARSGQDYVGWMGAYLQGSDNPGFLRHGYLYMGIRPGGERALGEALVAHPNPDGRLGALEGLRKSATSGRIAPEEITARGLAALEDEADERNRLLLYEMVISTGGPEGLDRIEEDLRSGRVVELDKTAELLALSLEPGRARALFEDLLRDQALQGEAKEAVYRAMGLVPGEEGADFLLALARNDELEVSERLAGLRGLWNRPQGVQDSRVARELADVFESSEDAELRTEALRMLVYGRTDGGGLDLRGLATLDSDPTVRAEALQLAAMQPQAGTRQWLEERLFQDDSLDVKAAALGALVYQAHYTGEGEAVLGYLERARKLTTDEQTLAMIAEGERMVRDHDPRNLELELAEEAEFWGSVARYADGPAAASLQRRAMQLGGIVSSLRLDRDGRRPAR